MTWGFSWRQIYWKFYEFRRNDIITLSSVFHPQNRNVEWLLEWHEEQGQLSFATVSNICIIFHKTFKICIKPLNFSVLYISSSLKSPAFQVCYSTLADCSRFLTQFQFNFVYELFYVLFCLPKGLCPFILFPSFVSQFVHFRFYFI